jgi:bifunctional DNase/RNase
LRILKYRYKTKRARKRFDHIKWVFVGIALVSVVLVLVVYLQDQDISPIPIITGLSTAGYEKVIVDAALVNGYGIVGLESECYQIIANVESYQAESIIMGLEGIVPSRPNSHDIAVDAFNTLGIEVLMVKVTEVRNETFYGKMILRNGNSIASLDARPSDATAIAVRMDVPIYVKEDVLREYGEYIC